MPPPRRLADRETMRRAGAALLAAAPIWLAAAAGMHALGADLFVGIGWAVVVVCPVAFASLFAGLATPPGTRAPAIARRALLAALVAALCACPGTVLAIVAIVATDGCVRALDIDVLDAVWGALWRAGLRLAGAYYPRVVLFGAAAHMGLWLGAAVTAVVATRRRLRLLDAPAASGPG